VCRNAGMAGTTTHSFHCTTGAAPLPAPAAGQASPQARELRISCQSNLASCHLQLERWQECVDVCGAVLAADPNNRKALYRRGEAERRGGQLGKRSTEGMGGGGHLRRCEV
jgi:hypothetical protein